MTNCPTCGTSGYTPPEHVPPIWRPKPDSRQSPDDHCWDFADGLDGFVIHTETCPDVGKSWIGGVGSSSCIRPTRWHGAWPDWVRRSA